MAAAAAVTVLASHSGWCLDCLLHEPNATRSKVVDGYSPSAGVAGDALNTTTRASRRRPFGHEGKAVGAMAMHRNSNQLNVNPT